MAKKKLHGTRAMLNLPGYQTTGAIVAECDSTRGVGIDNPDYPRWGPEITLQIADCDRSISFDFESFDSEGGRENNLHKLDTMISALTLLREGIDFEQKKYVRARSSGRLR
jgi:hypothetical protein